MIVAILCMMILGGLWGLYAFVKNIGAKQVTNEINNETLKDVKKAKKLEAEHANDSMSDVSDRLRK